MNVFRLYNQNRKLFWIIIVAIILFVGFIQMLNSMVIEEKNKPKNVIVDEKLYENKISIEEQISDKQVEEEKELIIDQFIRYCNAKNIQEAYNLLTDECREELFPTLDVFENNYIKTNFNTQKLYSKEEYSGTTYKIKMYENMLSTGITDNTNEDYYTIVKQDDDYKLNISNYIKREESNRKFENDKIKVETIKKDVYMEYEIYTLQVTNLTENMILLDTKENTKSIYLLDRNNVKYYAMSHEILDNSLKIRPKATNTIEIKYVKEYKSASSKSLVFEDIILNYIDDINLNEYERMSLEVGV